MVDVELGRYVIDEPGGPYVSWAAEWGLRGDSSGTEDGDEDLQELVDGIVEDITRSWAAKYPNLRIEWTIVGDPPAGQTVDDAIAATGVTLPTTLLPG